MAPPRFDSEGFVELWPTTILRRRLPGHNAANLELVRLITELEGGRQDFTTDYRSGNLLTLENPAVAWLRDCINRTMVDYLKHAGLDYQVNWGCRAGPT